MPFTPEETTVFLRAIRELKEFRNKFAPVADSIQDKIYSYFTNPNCSCKGAILNWINENETATREVINTFKEDFEKLKASTLPAASPVPPVTQQVPAKPQQLSNIKIGDYAMIEPTPEAYKKLFETAKKEHWVFRGIQVMPGDDDGKDVWIVLFY